jgi:hypothetical protein
MSLKTKLKAELLASPGSGPRVIGIPAGDLHLVCELADVNPLAVELSKLVVTTPKLAKATIDQLAEISKKISARVTYLLEAIGPVELDAESCTVQLRSVPPLREEEGTSYYEILVRRGGEVALCRYQKMPSEPRRVIPAIVTREVLYRLAEDFEAVLLAI